MEEKKITVEFKESYMPHSVKRTCVNMTKKQVIEQYGLNSSDIEWYKFIEEQLIIFPQFKGQNEGLLNLKCEFDSLWED